MLFHGVYHGILLTVDTHEKYIRGQNLECISIYGWFRFRLGGHSWDDISRYSFLAICRRVTIHFVLNYAIAAYQLVLPWVSNRSHPVSSMEIPGNQRISSFGLSTGLPFRLLLGYLFVWKHPRSSMTLWWTPRLVDPGQKMWCSKWGGVAGNLLLHSGDLHELRVKGANIGECMFSNKSCMSTYLIKTKTRYLQFQAVHGNKIFPKAKTSLYNNITILTKPAWVVM